MLSVVAIEGLHLEQMDVKMIFLYGDLEEEIYMQQLKGYVEKGREHLDNVLLQERKLKMEWAFLWNVDSYVQLHNFKQELRFQRNSFSNILKECHSISNRKKCNSIPILGSEVINLSFLFCFINFNDSDNTKDVLVMVNLVGEGRQITCGPFEHLVGIEGVGVLIGQRRGVRLVV